MRCWTVTWRDTLYSYYLVFWQADTLPDGRAINPMMAKMTKGLYVFNMFSDNAFRLTLILRPFIPKCYEACRNRNTLSELITINCTLISMETSNQYHYLGETRSTYTQKPRYRRSVFHLYLSLTVVFTLQAVVSGLRETMSGHRCVDRWYCSSLTYHFVIEINTYIDISSISSTWIPNTNLGNTIGSLLKHWRSVKRDRNVPRGTT